MPIISLNSVGLMVRSLSRTFDLSWVWFGAPIINVSISKPVTYTGEDEKGG